MRSRSASASPHSRVGTCDRDQPPDPVVADGQRGGDLERLARHALGRFGEGGPLLGVRTVRRRRGGSPTAVKPKASAAACSAVATQPSRRLLAVRGWRPRARRGPASGCGRPARRPGGCGWRPGGPPRHRPRPAAGPRGRRPGVGRASGSCGSAARRACARGRDPSPIASTTAMAMLARKGTASSGRPPAGLADGQDADAARQHRVGHDLAAPGCSSSAERPAPGRSAARAPDRSGRSRRRSRPSGAKRVTVRSVRAARRPAVVVSSAGAPDLRRRQPRQGRQVGRLPRGDGARRPARRRRRRRR